MKTIVKACLSFCILSFTLILFAFCKEHNTQTAVLDKNREKSVFLGNDKILIAYFSRANHVPKGTDGVSGATNKEENTRTVAYYIKQKTGGEIFEILPKRNYPVSHSKCSAIAQQEIKDNARPSLASHVEMNTYSIIFVGFPIWVYREPMAVLSFLEEYDFKGKIVIPFCTSMAVDISQSMEDLKKTLPDITIKQGLRLGYTLSGDWQSDVNKWLEKLQIKTTINKDGKELVTRKRILCMGQRDDVIEGKGNKCNTNI